MLGGTLKLGYLECAVGSGDHCAVLRNSTSSPELSRKSLAGTLKLNDKIESASCRGYVQDEPPICPLEWTHAPVRQVQREGNTRYQVSKPAIPSQRKLADGKMHLVRTTRIDPQPSSRSSSRPTSRQAERIKSAEKIVVTEADFRRCGHRLTLLRGCQLERLPAKPKVEEVKNELELSFKSAFRKRCSSMDHPISDPWAGYANPEEYRAAHEGDLVLNQVWVAESSPKKSESSSDDDPDATMLPSARSMASTRASSMDGITSWPLGPTAKELKQQQTDYAKSRRSSRRPPSHRRAQSLSAITPREISSRDSRDSRREARRESRSRQAGHASGIPKPGSASGRESSVKKDSPEKTKAKPKEFQSRIQLIDDDVSDDAVEEKAVGSHATRQAIRMQRRFEREMDEETEHNQKPLALWVSLDPLSGEPSLFPRAAATRLEASYVNNRQNVPLAGLGEGLEDSIVYLGKKGGDQHPVLKSFTGGHLDVRRLIVLAGAREACVTVACEDGMWHIADVALPGSAAEQRRIALNGTEMVRPPTPPLPPMDPDRRANFFNIGSDPDLY